jgi:hypothetical protein
MCVETSPLSVSDQDDLRRFLASIFGISMDSPLLAPALLEWKFFTPHPDWEGPRSYVTKDNDCIVAHSCIWPVRFSLGGRVVSSMHLIDWAASSDAAGAGALLNRELMKMTDTAIGLGASAIGTKVARRMGFQPYGSIGVYTRVLRPWHQFLRRPGPKPWKSPLYLLRNARWAAQPVASPKAGWRAVEVPRFESSADAMFRERASFNGAVAVRTVDVLNYILQCPAITAKAFLVYEKNSLRGYYLLSRTGMRTMLADLWVGSQDEEVWATALSLATRSAAADPNACEFRAFSSIPLVTTALLRNHFHLRAEKPLLVFDLKRQLKDHPMFVTPLESDAFYLYEPDAPFLT